MSNFEIKDQNDLFNKISEWNITVKKYPDGFPKDCVKPLKKSYKSMDEYRKVKTINIYKFIFIFIYLFIYLFIYFFIIYNKINLYYFIN